MSQFLRETLLLRGSSQVRLQSPNTSSLRLRWFSVSSEDNRSFVVSYLIYSLGFSPEKALSASKYLRFNTREKPDKAVQFLTNSGFSKTQISNLVRIFPRALLLTEKYTLPKLEYLKSKGISDDEMTKILSSYPLILSASLRNRIVPLYDYLRSFLRSDERTVAVVKRYPDILRCRFKDVASNADTLRGHGVPESKIAKLFLYKSRALVSCPDRFCAVVEEVEEMGFNPSTTKFILAVKVFMSLTRSTRQRKVEAYKKCGFSGEEVSKAFRSDPHSMTHSEGKIAAVMDFSVNEMNWSPSIVSTYPSLLGMSLERRIVPRCSVFKALASKGLAKKKVFPGTLMDISEARFLAKYVEPYEKEAPEILELYREKLGLRAGPAT